MAKAAPSPLRSASPSRIVVVVVVLLLLLIPAPKPCECLSFTQYRTLVSLAHSLTTRVANLRDSRGDLPGAERARSIALQLERGMGVRFWGLTWSVGWDFLQNYAWRGVDYADLSGAVSDTNKLVSSLLELNRMDSNAEKAVWIGKNYENVLGISNSLLRRLLKVFRQPGLLRDVVETVQREVVEGGLLRDCLEIGANDLKGLLQIFKDVAVQHYNTSDDDWREL